MTRVIGKNEIIQAMINSKQEHDVPVTDRVNKAIDGTFPVDCRRWVKMVFEDVLGYVPRNQEWIEFLAWTLVSRNPWTPDPLKITSIRRLRVLEFIESLVAIYQNEFSETQYTMAVAGQVVTLANYYKLWSLTRTDINEIVLTIAQQERIPIWGVMLAIYTYMERVKDLDKDETKNALNCWLLYYNRDVQRFKQIELF